MKIFMLEYIRGEGDSGENWGVYSTLERAKEVQNALCNLKDYNFFLESSQSSVNSQGNHYCRRLG